MIAPGASQHCALPNGAVGSRGTESGLRAHCGQWLEICILPLAVDPVVQASSEWRPQAPRCPRCHGALYRVRRSWTDRVISLVMPVRRYQCDHAGCHWEGRLRAEHRG